VIVNKKHSLGVLEFEVHLLFLHPTVKQIILVPNKVITQFATRYLVIIPSYKSHYIIA